MCKLCHLFIILLILGIYFAASILKDPTRLDILDQEWPTLGNMILFNKSADEITDNDKEIMKKIKVFYYGDDTSLTKGSSAQLIEMFGDAYTFGANEYFSSLIMSQSAQPVYMYSFDYHGSWRFGDLVTLPLLKLIHQLIMSSFGIKVEWKKQLAHYA